MNDGDFRFIISFYVKPVNIEVPLYSVRIFCVYFAKYLRNFRGSE